MTKSSDWFLRPRKHHTGGIWERSFHTENASDFFRPDWAGGIQQRKNHQSFWTCVWRKLGKGNRVIIVTSSFSFSAKCFFSSSQNRKAGVFKVPPKIVFEKLRCRHWFGVDDRSNRRNKSAFSNSSGFKSFFQKLRFRDWFGVDGRPTLEIKLRFQIYSATLVRMLPEKSAGERISHSSS